MKWNLKTNSSARRMAHRDILTHGDSIHPTIQSWVRPSFALANESASESRHISSLLIRLTSTTIRKRADFWLRVVQSTTGHSSGKFISYFELNSYLIFLITTWYSAHWQFIDLLPFGWPEYDPLFQYYLWRRKKLFTRPRSHENLRLYFLWYHYSFYDPKMLCQINKALIPLKLYYFYYMGGKKSAMFWTGSCVVWWGPTAIQGHSHQGLSQNTADFGCCHRF